MWRIVGFIVFSTSLWLIHPIQARTLRIATGPEGSGYNMLAKMICETTQEAADKPIYCEVTAHLGSAQAVQYLEKGKADFALVQADVLAKNKTKNVSYIADLYVQTFTVVVRADSDIKRVSELADKRLGIDIAHSDNAATARALFAALGWRQNQLKLTQAVPSTLVEQLCADQIDAILINAAHPDRLVREATTACDARLMPVTGKTVDQLVRAVPVYQRSIIPPNIYWKTPESTPSFGMSAVWVTNTSLSDEAVTQSILALESYLIQLSADTNKNTRLDIMLKPTIVDGKSYHPAASAYFTLRAINY